MKHNYTYRIQGELEPKLVGKDINRVYPDFFKKAKLFFSTQEGMAEFVKWLRALPEEGPLAECRAELPMWEARLKEMEVG